MQRFTEVSNFSSKYV